MTLSDFLALCEPDTWIVIQNHYDGKVCKFKRVELYQRRIFRISPGLNVIRVQLCRG